MKISEMTNEQAAEALVRLSEPLSNICNDENTLEALKKLSTMKGKPTVQVFGSMIPSLASISFKDHKQDMFEIAGALQNIPASKVAKMNFKETIKIMKDSYDEIFRDFFT